MGCMYALNYAYAFRSICELSLWPEPTLKKIWNIKLAIEPKNKHVCLSLYDTDDLDFPLTLMSLKILVMRHIYVQSIICDL